MSMKENNIFKTKIPEKKYALVYNLESDTKI